MGNKQFNSCDVLAILRRHCINPTRQRLEIARALFARQEHLSADQVLCIVNERCVGVSKATVYNTLNLFVRKKLVREVIVDPNRVFYDPNTAPHHHFFDVASGRLTDIEVNAISLTGSLPVPEGMVAEGIDVIVRIRPAD